MATADPKQPEIQRAAVYRLNSKGSPSRNPDLYRQSIVRSGLASVDRPELSDVGSEPKVPDAAL
ncbi:hypothetical protein, partial [Roseobacter sp. MH60115]|uniref:hypothetical protein n=1 Tax=Roseobacter sp. MH60115 TaxID=2785324 RepID=UPI001E28FF47